MPSFNKCGSQFQPKNPSVAQISDLTNEWVRDDEKMSKNPQFILYHDLISLLGHKKADKAKILNIILFYIKCLKLNPNQAKERRHAPFRVTLAPSRANATSWSKTLALPGLLQPATHANTAKSASQDIHKVGWRHDHHGWHPGPSRVNVPMEEAQPP